MGFAGAAFSDDLEMGALQTFGAMPDRCAEAARAGCDLLFVCSRIAEYPDCVERVARDVPEERLREAGGRLDAYTRRAADLAARGAASGRSPRPIELLREAVENLREEALVLAQDRRD